MSSSSDRRATIVDAAGRHKAYRPLPAAARAASLRRGLTAYEGGEFFEAHEILEPAWMGTDDPAERDLYQGLIKLCAAYVHAVRGNPRGWEKNLRGARERLARGLAGGPAAGIDVSRLLESVDERLRMGAEAKAPSIPRRR